MPYWAGQVEIQRKMAEGAILFYEGGATGLDLLRQAADAEDATDKSPVTPGPLVPARELYADHLWLARRLTEALAEYEKTLTREPGRYRSIAGAMLAAQLSNDTAKARKYATALLALTKGAAPGRPDIQTAQKLVR